MVLKRAKWCVAKTGVQLFPIQRRSKKYIYLGEGGELATAQDKQIFFSIPNLVLNI